MAEVIEGVSPTRMELLKLTRRVKLAEKGHDLLKEKRDALIAEFLDVVSEVRAARKEMEEKLKEAFNNLILAQALLGVENVRQISLITAQKIALDFDTRSIMGVSVPIIEAESLSRKATERGYGFVDTSAVLDRCAQSFEEALEKVIKVAEVEETVRRLAEEVEKTKRRVNALEYILIPRLKATRKYIQMRLDEMERENFIRLKKIKAILERRGR
ncbi:V-type ATP synthase subunit D [Candidatus Alkanophaga liquidiphilum]|nr:Archaeal/vacuolar-type H+-ATPase subunit D/Vma8 [Candidatus Alkanophaga liquidiphilum]RLG37488.1 MAG: V-type ATP synthase subunit D [Candidatus Alkanophagales archaeon]